MHDVGRYIPLCRSLTSLPGSPRVGNKIRRASSFFPSLVPKDLLRLGTWSSCFFPSLSPRISSGWERGPLPSFQALSPRLSSGWKCGPLPSFQALSPRLSLGWEHGPLSSCARLAPRFWTSCGVGWGGGGVHLFQNVRTV